MADYKLNFYSFSEHPDSDSCWSLSTGPDGRIYAASCSEISPGGIVKLTRHDSNSDSTKYLFDIDEAVNDPWNSGRATQCKIHYSFAPSKKDGIMYMATHLSGPPFDQQFYSPWLSWNDPKRCFRGSAIIAYDVNQDKILSWDTMIPKEGCRCLCLDEDNDLLYSISYPRDHLIVYDIKKRQQRDIGRIGSVNSQALFLDKRHRVWTTDDSGHFIRYDPKKDVIEYSPLIVPHDNKLQSGWHSVLYDVVSAPDGESVFATAWAVSPHLMRIWPDKGEWGKIDDLGPITQEHDLNVPMDLGSDHCGGLTFGPDGYLYYGASRRKDSTHNSQTTAGEEQECVIWKMNIETLKREEVVVLEREDGIANYLTRGAIDKNGDLFFGTISHGQNIPAGYFKLQIPEENKIDIKIPLRVWG